MNLRGAGRRQFQRIPGKLTVQSVVLAVTLLLFGPGVAPEAGPPPGFDPEKQFTISDIEPDAAKEEVRIFFSHPVPVEVIRPRLQLVPPVKIHWDKSSLSEAGVLTLRGAFRYGAHYFVNLPETLTYQRRQYVKGRNTFFLPDLTPKAEFVDHKSVIERDSRQLLQVRVRNLDAVQVEGVKVPPILLPLAVAYEADPGDWRQFQTQLKAGVEELLPLIQGRGGAVFGQPPWQGLTSILFAQPREDRQLFATQGQKNQPLAFSLPLTFRQDKETGASLMIRLLNPQEPDKPVGGPQLFRLTDLGLTYKLGQQNLLVWVTSIKSGKPAAGVHVLAFTRDLEVFPLGQTDADGILTFNSRELAGLSLKQPGRFGPVQRPVNHREIAFLLAGTVSDVSYIALRPQGDLKPEGIWQAAEGETVKNRRGYVFTDRGVYRPGEKVSFKGAIREYRDGMIAPPGAGAYRFVITSPKGEEVYSQEVSLSEFGGAWGEMVVQPHLPRGTYTLALKLDTGAAGTREDLPPGEEEDEGVMAPVVTRPEQEASCTFQVQDFKPPRHFVDISFNRFTRPESRYVNRPQEQEFVRITIAGSYYAGGPVKHGQVRWKVNTASTSFQAPGFADFLFGSRQFDKAELLESGQAILDENGRAVVEFPLDSRVLSGLQGLSVVATVVDFDGRSVSSSKDFQVAPDILVGIRVHPTTIRAGEEQLLKAIVTQNGKQIKRGQVRAEVLQRTGAYAAKRNAQGDVYWDYQDIWRQLWSNDLSLKNGEASLRFDFKSGGEYLISFSYEDNRGRRFASSTTYRVTGDFYWDDYENRHKPYRSLAISADRPEYEPGQTARIMVSPRRPVARYLVTLEQNGVLEHRVLAAPSGLQLIDIPIKAEYTPNVYLSVLGVTAREDFPAYASRYDSGAPDFFWGNLNLPVRRQAERLEVKINASQKELKFEPGAQVELEFSVNSRDGKGVEAEMAVAVVDERVLALTAFKTPDPASLVLFTRPLEVFTGELRSMLMHQTPFSLARIDPLTGGGGLEPGAEAMMGKIRKRFDPCAYFNPALWTDKEGRARATFVLPDTLTTYRIYTVVLDRGSRLANAERPLLATKDFFLEPGLPAFLTLGDRFRFQVAAVNATAGAGPLTFRAEAEGGLKLSGETVNVQLPANDSIKVEVAGAAEAPGPALARFHGEFQGRRDSVEEALSINSGQVLETTVHFGSLTESTDLKISLPPYAAALEESLKGEVQAVLTLAGSPFLRLTQAMRYLLTYPYGCVEQVSSGVLGLAALRGVVQEGLAPGITVAEVDAFLTKGVSRILAMQLDDGGFGYWPGSPKVHPWGTVYAAMALSLAKNNGLEIPASALENAASFLKEQMRNPRNPDLLRAYGTYILSLTGALDRETFQAMQRDYLRLSREGKMLVLLAGHRTSFLAPKELQAALKPLLLGATEPAGWSLEDDFHARYRGPALTLLAAKTILPNDPATSQTALALLGGLDNQGIWTSTSDTGWALLALGEYFRGYAFDAAPMNIAVQQPGGPPQQLTLDPRGFRTLSLDPRILWQNPSVRLTKPGKSALLYKIALTVPRADIAQEGVDHGVKIWKQIKNTDGSSEIKVGDLVKVSVFAQLRGRDQRYVVLDDPLPAGLMAINPAFATETARPEGEEGNGEPDPFEYLTPGGIFRFRPDFFEIRSDRVLAFKDQLFAGTHLFEYYARAVCQGEFVQPAAKAAAMYNPAIYGYGVKGALTVKGRQP